MKRLRDLMQALQPRIPESLLAGEGWDRLLARVGDLPAAAAAGLCGFELKLDDPAPAADFSVAVTPGPVARHFPASSEAATTSTEARLAAYLADWSRPDDWLMLAYDIVGVAEGRKAAPAVYVRPDARSGTGLPSNGAAFDPDRLAEILGGISGGSGDGDGRRALTRAFAALPPAAVAVFAAVAPERVPGSIRLVVAEVAVPQLEGFLSRLQWPGSMSMVLRLLSGMRDVSDRFMVAFDVTRDGALPRLGFEMYPTAAAGAGYQPLLSTWLTTTRADWRGLISHLGDMALCLPEKAEGLLSWPKCNIVYGESGAWRLYMGINHVKMVIDAERLQAKAYAGLKCCPLNPGGDLFGPEAGIGPDPAMVGERGGIRHGVGPGAPPAVRRRCPDLNSR
ncbi:MAG: hypothetical protein OXS40_06855 [Gammaproteobacteria bacterium]|nr:hypothetical protein [Gammaproteobacteria bacterium]